MQHRFTTLCNTSLLLLSFFALSAASADTMKNADQGMMTEAQTKTGAMHSGAIPMDKEMTTQDASQMKQESMGEAKIGDSKDQAMTPRKKSMH
jgi:hypothetical protein